MEVLRGPWADLALLLRQTAARADGESQGFLPACLLSLLVFLTVCLLLLQTIIYLCWKLRQVEAELSDIPQDGGAPYGPMDRGAHLRSRRRSMG